MPRKHEPMPKALQMYVLKKHFGKLDSFTIDEYVDDHLTLPENLWNLEKNHSEDILKARIEMGYTEAENARLFGWDDWAVSREDFWKEAQEYEWEMEKDEPDVSEAEIEPQEDEGWHVEKTEEGEVHTIEVEVEPHRVVAKSKTYDYGRIQLNVNQGWVGLIAKISVNIPEELL